MTVTSTGKILVAGPGSVSIAVGKDLIVQSGGSISADGNTTTLGGTVNLTVAGGMTIDGTISANGQAGGNVFISQGTAAASQGAPSSSEGGASGSPATRLMLLRQMIGLAPRTIGDGAMNLSATGKVEVRALGSGEPGGLIDAVNAGDVWLNGKLDASAQVTDGLGGEIIVNAGGRISGSNASAASDARGGGPEGEGGSNCFIGDSFDFPGDVQSGAVGADTGGGVVEIIVTGNINVAGNVSTNGGNFGSGDVTLDTTSGNVGVGAGSDLDVSATDGGRAGSVVVTAPNGSVTFNGSVIGHGGDGTPGGDGGEVDILAGSNIEINAAVLLDGGAAGGFGGLFNAEAAAGEVTVNTTISARGDSPSPGGAVTLVGCGVTVPVTGRIEADDGGVIELTGSTKVEVAGDLDSGAGGSNQLRWRDNPPLVTGTINPNPGSTMDPSLSSCPPGTPTASPTKPPSRTRTPTATPTSTRTHTVSPTVTPTVNPEFTPTVTPTVTATPTVTPTPMAATISGRIVYYRGDRPVPGVEVELLGAPPQSTMTDANGDFAFADEVPRTRTLDPGKSGGDNGAIGSLDAAFAQQIRLGSREADPLQFIACDVTGNGEVSSLDAARIQQFRLGQLSILPVTEECGDWAFVPDPIPAANQTVRPPMVTLEPCQPGAIDYSPLVSSVANQNFIAILFGDCTGNWAPLP